MKKSETPPKAGKGQEIRGCMDTGIVKLRTKEDMYTPHHEKEDEDNDPKEAQERKKIRKQDDAKEESDRNKAKSLRPGKESSCYRGMAEEGARA